MLHNICVHFHDESLVTTLLGCFLKAEMSKSNAHNLLDSEEQHWQSTTNFAKREAGEMHLRNNYDVLNVNVRNLF